MNHIYRLIWNRKLRVWQAASELASQSQGGRSSTVAGAAAVTPRLALRIALTLGLSAASSAAYALCTAAGTTVTCAPPDVSGQPNYVNAANNLVVSVLQGANLGTDLSAAQWSMNLSGTNARLTNAGTINAGLLGDLTNVSGGVHLGNANTQNIHLDNKSSGLIVGSTGVDSPLPNLQGMAVHVENGAGGLSTVTNAGVIRGKVIPIPGFTMQDADVPVIAMTGGGKAEFVNDFSGSITGRIAFEASGTAGTGHQFVNAGLITGGVSLGNGGYNTFTAVSGSVVTAGAHNATGDLAVVGMPGVKFAPPGKIDAGTGGNNTLVLQNVLPATGVGSGTTGAPTNASGDTYVNFQNLKINSGTWNLNGMPLTNGGIIQLNGGRANLANSAVLGAGQIFANGGTLSADTGVTLNNYIIFGPDGLNLGGANAITLAGPLSGAGSLTASGTGVVTLSNIYNNYAGGTAIHAGATLQGNASSLQGDIAVDGVLRFDQGVDGAYASNISGAGQVFKRGAGTLTLSGTHTYTGNTVVSAGTLAIGPTGRLAVSTIQLAPGAVLDLTSAPNQTIGGLDGSGGSVMLGANRLTLNASDPATFSGAISGAGTLVKMGRSRQTLDGATSFTGGLIVDNGELILGPNGSLAGNPTLTVNTNGMLDISAGLTHSFSQLNGDGGEVWIGSNGLGLQSGTYAGAIMGPGGLQKNGAGTLTLNGANAYTGSTEVVAGALRIGGDSAHWTASIDSPIVTVSAGASLGGFGTITGDVQVLSNGSLTPGEPRGVLTVVGDLSMDGNSQANFSFGAPGSSTSIGAGHSVSVVGNLVLSGVQLNVRDAGGMGPGVYRLFDYTGTLTLWNGGLLGRADKIIQVLPSAQQVNMVNIAGLDLNFWNADGQASQSQMGGGTGIWSNANANWTDALGTVTATRQPADAFAIFGGNAGTVTVDAAAGGVAAKGIQFASDGYRLTGDTLELTGAAAGEPGELRVGAGNTASAAWTATVDNVLTGAGIDKTGAGTLVLNGANTYTQTTRLTEGTLSVASNANLGAPTAGLDFQGGTLQVTGTSFQSTTRAINFGAGGGGFDIADAANTFTVAQPLIGSGGLAKLGAGTLALTGDNTYAGGTTVRGGVLQVGDGAVSGSIAGNVAIDSGATLAFMRSDRVVFDGLLSGAGQLRQSGAGTLVLTGQNTLAGVATIASGTLQVGDGGTAGAYTGDIVNHGSLVFNRSDDLSYAGALSGGGAMAKLGAGTLALTGDSSAYAGDVQLTAGALQVDGKLGGQLHAATGTTLAGTGTLNSVTIASGATLAPANASTPFGQMNLLGNLDFAPGAAYRVSTHPEGQSSSVHVAGTATLAGSVVQLARNGNYAPSTTYQILTADQGVLGRFDSVSSNLAFLTPSLAYGANNVDLVVNLKDVPVDDGSSRPIEFADAATTGNQRAVARSLQSLSTGSALYQHVLNLPNGAPPSAFNALSGEAHASLMSGLQASATTFTQAPLARLRGNLNAGWMPGAPTAQLGLGDAAALPRSSAQPLWTQLFGNWTTLGGNGNTAKTSQSDAGVTIGGDHAVGGGWRLGGALGYTDSHTRTGDRASSSEADSYSLTVYGGKAFNAGAGKINLSLGAAYTWHDLKTQRNTAAAGLNQTLKASYGASTGQVFTELGYAVPLNDRVTLEPFLGANYSDLRTRGFSESGGDAALRGESGSNKVTTTTLGLHALTTFESAGARGQVHGTLGWRHAFGDLDPASTLSFVQGSDSFTATGAPIARDAAVLELGVGIEVSKRTTVSVIYGGQFGDGNRQNSGTLDVRYRF